MGCHLVRHFQARREYTGVWVLLGQALGPKALRDSWKTPLDRHWRVMAVKKKKKVNPSMPTWARFMRWQGESYLILRDTALE